MYSKLALELLLLVCVVVGNDQHVPIVVEASFSGRVVSALLGPSSTTPPMIDSLQQRRVPFLVDYNKLLLMDTRGGSTETTTNDKELSNKDVTIAITNNDETTTEQEQHDDDVDSRAFGRISKTEFRLTPEQVETFFREGCVTIPNVLYEDEVAEIESIFDRFMEGEIHVPDKDFCDMSKPFGIPRKDWSIVNCMLPTTYYPPLGQNNIYEQLTQSIARQLYPTLDMTKDYDQFLNKLPGKTDAVFAWHQDMGYWPGPKALLKNIIKHNHNKQEGHDGEEEEEEYQTLVNAVSRTETCTFSLAIDDSKPSNGCLRYVVGSGRSKTLRPHVPLAGPSREDGHALTIRVDDENEVIKLAPASRGSITIHDEYVVHGSGGNTDKNSQRRTYVLAYRPRAVVRAERAIGFTHSHNDDINWDTFQDGELHRIGSNENNNNDKEIVLDEQQKVEEE